MKFFQCLAASFDYLAKSILIFGVFFCVSVFSSCGDDDNSSITPGAASLSALRIGPGKLTPAFNPAITEYSTSVDYFAEKFRVTPSGDDSASAIEVNGVGVQSGEHAGLVALREGSNAVEIDVLDVDGNVKTYTVNITRKTETEYPYFELDYTAGQDNEMTIEYDGIERRFFYYVPADFDSEASHSVIVVLHGFNQDVSSIIQTYGSMKTLADDDGTIIIFPESTGSSAESTLSWNQLYGDLSSIYETLNEVDDIGYISYLINTMLGNMNGDPDRVYVTGTSMGGAMTFALSTFIPGKFAAAAPVIMQVAQDFVAQFQDAQPLPYMVITGTADPLVDPDGTDTGTIKNVSQAASIEYLKIRNGLTGDGEMTALPDTVTEVFQGEDANSYIEQYVWESSAGNDLFYLKVVNGGHWLPSYMGGMAMDPSNLGGWDGSYLGHWNNDYDAAAGIYNFFMNYTR